MKLHHWLILFIVLASCEIVLDVDLPKEAPKLVVNAQLVADSTVKVHLSQSWYILDDPAYTDINATVSIFEDGAFKEQLQKTQEYGPYFSQFTLKEGKTYTLKAEAPNYAPVEATSFLAPKVPIQTIVLDSTIEYTEEYCIEDSCDISYSVRYQVDLTFQDPANIANYYSITGYYINIHTYTEHYPDGSSEEVTREERYPIYLYSENILLASGDFDIDGNGQWGDELLFSDKLFDGKTSTFNFKIENYSSHSARELTIVLKHLSEAQYKYQVSNKLQNQNLDNPFAEPVQVYNNIENGYGIFAGYSADTKVVKP